VGDRAARRHDDCIGLALVLRLRSATTASLVTLFAAYLAADGFFAILTAKRETRPALVDANTGGTDKSRSGWLGSSVACNRHGRVPSYAEHMGHRHRRLLLAAARRHNQTHGRWMLAFAGAVSTGWGILLATIGPDAENEPGATAAWLVTYAVLFGVTLLALSVHLRRRHHRSGNLTARGWRDGRVTSGATPP
jgi:hypothetical protein